MRHFLLAALALTLSTPALAQKIKVKKVKGNSAVVESTAPLRAGQSYDLISPDEFGEEIGSTPRKYLVGMNFSLTNTKSDAVGTSNETNLDMAVKLGWNLGTYEVGPLVDFTITHANDITQTIWKVGGFGDYNFIPNVAGETFIWGIGATGSIGNWDRGSGVKVDLFDVFGGPFVKWFPTSSAVGFRMDLGFTYERQSASSDTVTVSGLGSTAGIFAYF